MKTLESAENYLETILMLSKNNNEVRSIDIANELEFSRPSVSIAMKKLHESECILIDSQGAITLTKKGLEIAEKVYERHQIITDFFVNLGVSKDIALNDACRIEHIISDETFSKIKECYKNFLK